MLSPASYVVCAYRWSNLGSFLVGGCVSFSQDVFQCDDLWEIASTHYELVTPLSLGPFPRVRAFSAHILGWKVPLQPSKVRGNCVHLVFHLTETQCACKCRISKCHQETGHRNSAGAQLSPTPVWNKVTLDSQELGLAIIRDFHSF